MSTINDEKKLMEKYGISCKQKFVYQYKQYRYDNFQNALNFAVQEQDKNKEGEASGCSEKSSD